jgi:hypothetical protein
MRSAEHVVQMGETYKNWDEENRWEKTLGRIHCKIRCVVVKCMICFDVSSVCVRTFFWDITLRRLSNNYRRF